MSKFRLQDIIRPNISTLIPYSSARDEFKGVASVFLDANENSLGSSAGSNYNRYPDPLQKIHFQGGPYSLFLITTVVFVFIMSLKKENKIHNSYGYVVRDKLY